MANHVLETIIQLRYGTYAQWMNSDIILKVGEAAICSFPRERVVESMSNIRPENTPPAIGIKIGDGERYFSELPWVQAIAADVYNWAKSPSKPSYTAQEIQGLQNYIENMISGDVEVNIAPRIYQIVRGTEEDIDKYYLRYKEANDESEWVLDTSEYIDLTNLTKIVDWIGLSNIDNYPNLITRIAELINYFLGTLTVADEEINNQFVTSVSETNGVINVTRARPNFSNINGIAAVNQGGTGRTSLTEDSVLVGNGTDQVKLIPIADSIANNNHLVPNNLIKSYVDSAVAGLSGAMHFIGDATVVINNNSAADPRIGGYNFSQAQPGDVILYDAKEFVWTGSSWRLLGDEGSYAVKGSIKDIDIDPEAAIQQSKIANLSATFNTKVDKVEGKDLSTNDYSDEDKQKLAGIDEGAQVNAIEHILLNNNEIIPRTINGISKAINLIVNEFDESSRTKLESIQSGAQVNIIEHITVDGQEITPSINKTIALTTDPHTAHENKIEQIFINGIEWAPINKQVRIILDQSMLNLNVLEGATIPNSSGGRTEVTQVQKKLELEAIAVTGDVKDLRQTNDTYIILDCGSSTTVI